MKLTFLTPFFVGGIIAIFLPGDGPDGTGRDGRMGSGGGAEGGEAHPDPKRKPNKLIENMYAYSELFTNLIIGPGLYVASSIFSYHTIQLRSMIRNVQNSRRV